MPNVDSLSIEISASAKSANDALDKLVNTIERISTSLGGVNFNGFAQGIRNISTAMQGLQNIKMPDYTRLAKGIEKIGSINSAQIQQAGTAIKELSGSLRYLDSINVSDNSKQIAELANGIAKLGYSSSTKAIENIPKLATAMRELMSTLSTAPRVSRNLIDMTNALGNLARTGSSSGNAATSLGRSLNYYSSTTGKATKNSISLASAIGKLYAAYWLLFRAFGKIKDAIDISADLTEVQNVVDVTFGKYSALVEKMSETSITDFGMSELTVKQVSSRFQALGTAMGFTQGRMADMSIELTKLTADMASFYNVEQSDVAEDLASIFTGMTKPLRTYGLDLTEATLKEWALKQGMDADIDSMSQMEKTMLRYQYVMANTDASQGDFLRTQNTWSNQVRILTQNLQQLANVIGSSFINAFKSLISALNLAIDKFTDFSTAVSNSLGVIFGWKYEQSDTGITQETDDLYDLSDSLDDVTSSAKKAKASLRGFDELNVISTSDSKLQSSDNGGNYASSDSGKWVESESILKKYESNLDTLYKLGDSIGSAIADSLEGIEWETVYEKAENFGTGLADFLNGLISSELFGEVGETIASSLNTAIYASLSFVEEFDWTDFGNSLAEGVNKFFRTFDFKALAESLNEWVDGLKETIKGFLQTLTWKDIISGISDFLGTLELDTVAVLIGSFLLKNTISNLTEMLRNAFIAKISFATNPVNIPSLLVSVGKLILTSPEAIGVLGVQLGDLLNHSFLDPREWDNWIGDFSNAVYDFTIDLVDNVLGPAIVSVLDAIAQIISDTFNWDATMALFEDAKENFKEGGLNIVLGIIEGILSAVGLIIEPIGDFFVGLWNAFCEVFGIHSPADEMKPIGEYILLGIIEGFKNKFEDFTTAITEFFDSYIIPWFTKEKWQSISQNMKSGIESKWNEFSNWWQKSGVSKWFNEKVKPWFTKEKWSSVASSIKSGIETKWNEFTESWKNNGISKWFNNNVKPWFTKEKWQDSMFGIKDAFQNVFNNAANAAIEIFNKLIRWINEKMNFSWDALTIAGKTIVPSGNVQLFTIPEIPKFENGGFVKSASLFWAGENGTAEMLGTVGGRTAVASGNEITGIADAVYSTGQTEEQLLNRAVGLLEIIAQKEFGITRDQIGNSAREYAKDYFRRTGNEAYSF